VAIRRRGSPARGQVRSRRNTDWGVGPQSVQQTVSADITFIWTSGTTPSINFTLIRTRGVLTIVLTASASALDGFRGASGIYMMTEDAFAVGDSAALDPLDDANADMWLWHSFWDVRGGIGSANDVAQVVRIEIDSKAMRKDFDPERVMVGVTQAVEVGTATLVHNADTRQLLMQ